MRLCLRATRSHNPAAPDHTQIALLLNINLSDRLARERLEGLEFIVIWASVARQAGGKRRGEAVRNSGIGLPIVHIYVDNRVMHGQARVHRLPSITGGCS